MDRSFSVRLSANVDAYVNAMNKAKQSTAGWSKETEANMRKVGGQMQTVGRGMSTFVTLPLAAVGTAAVASAVSWESSWAGVTKTVNGTAAELSKLEGDLRGMAKTLPASHKEIAAVAEAAGALGVEASSIAGFTKVMVDLGETTNLSADEAATSIAQMMNVMGTAPADVDRLGAALVELGNNGASTEREILMMAQRISKSASVIGLSEAEVLAFGNALASAGIEAEAGGTAISRVMIDMASAVATTSDDLAGFAAVAGMSAQQFASAFENDPAQAILAFTEGLGKISESGGNVFGVLEDLGQADIRVRDSLLAMASSGDMLRESLDDGARAWDENSALTEEAAKRYDTTGAKMEIFRNRVVDMFISVAEASLPALNGILEFGGDAADAFASLPGPIQATAVGFLALVAAAGPMIWIGGSLVKNFHELKGGIAGMKTALTGMGLSAGAATTALGVFAGVVVAAGVAFLAYQSFTAKQREVSARAQEVAMALDESTRAALENADAANGAAIAHDALSNALTSTGDDGKKLTESLGALGLTTDDALQTLIDIGDDAVGTLKRLGVEAGLTAEQAEFLATAVADTEAAADGKWDWAWDPEDAGDIAAVVRDVADQFGLGKDQAEAMARAMEELQDQSEKSNLDKMLSSWLLTTAAASPLNQALLTQAETMSETKRSGDDLLPLYEQYLELLKQVGVEAGNLDASPWQTFMGPIFGGASDGAASLDEFLASLGGVGDEMDDTGVSASDMVDAVAAVTSVFDSAASAADRYSSSVEAVFSPQANLTNSIDDLYSSMDDLKSTVADNVEKYDEAGKSLDRASEAGRRNREGVEAQVEAIKAHGEALIATGSSADDAGSAMNFLRADLINQAEAMGLSRAEAEEYINALGLTPENISTAVQLSIDTAKAEEIEELKDDLGDIPEDVAATVDAQVEAGDLDGALETLTALQEATNPEVTVDVNDRALLAAQASLDTFQADAARGVTIPIRTSGVIPSTAFARGDVVDRATLAVFGEAGAEVVLPLTNQARMAELLADPRVGPKVAAALGAAMFADGAIIDGPGSSGVITSAWSQFLRKPDQQDDAAGVAKALDARNAARYEVGDMSASDYRQYLDARLGAFDKYSSEWMTIWRDIRSVEADEQRIADDRQKREENRLADAARIAEEEKRIEAERMAFMFEAGVISQQEYETFLQRRLGTLEQWSPEWMGVWRDINRLQDESEKAALDQREQYLADHLKRVEILYRQAEADRALRQAQISVDEALAAVGAAEASVGSAETDEERASAERSVDSARKRAADEAFRGAEARARANGLEPGTPDFARFVRSEVENFAAWQPNLAGYLDVWLSGLPQFAAGGFFPAQSGGHVAMLGRVAEAGQNEWLLPEQKLIAHAATAASMALRSGTSVDARLIVEGNIFGDTHLREVLSEHSRQVAVAVRAGKRN